MLGADPSAYANTLHQENEGVADLSAHEKPASRPTAIGPSKLESTVRYLGIEVDDALEMAEQTEV